MTMQSAASLETAGASAIARGVRVFDLSAVREMDSAALAVLFSWIRGAESAALSVRFRSIPAEVMSLADVYAVSDIIAAHSDDRQ